MPKSQSADARNERKDRKARKAGRILVPTALILLIALVTVPTANAVIQGHSPMVIQGHSPIVLLLTDPNGYQIGCTAIPCTSTSSPNFVNTIPNGTPYQEGPATYNFTTNAIFITSPIAGTWAVEYTGTSTGTFTITATTCPQPGGYAGSSSQGTGGTLCGNGNPVTVTLVTGTASSGQSGSTGFIFNADGTITLISTGVPEFPWGAGIMAGVLFVGLALVRSRRPSQLK